MLSFIAIAAILESAANRSGVCWPELAGWERNEATRLSLVAYGIQSLRQLHRGTGKSNGSFGSAGGGLHFSRVGSSDTGAAFGIWRAGNGGGIAISPNLLPISSIQSAGKANRLACEPNICREPGSFINFAAMSANAGVGDLLAIGVLPFPRPRFQRAYHFVRDAPIVRGRAGFKARFQFSGNKQI